MNQKKSLHYYFTYVYLPRFCLKNYETFKEFVNMGPAFLSNIFIGMWNGLYEKGGGDFVHAELPKDNPFKFSMEVINEEKKLFFIHMPQPIIVPEAFDICIVMGDKPRFFTLESDDSHIQKMKLGIPKEECNPVLFIGEWLSESNHRNYGSIPVSDHVKSQFTNKIKEICENS